MQSRFGLMKIICLLWIFGITQKETGAQENDLKPVTTKYVLKDAIVIPSPGQLISKGSILMEKGVIKAVGSNIEIPADAWVIDADSMYVYAGFISGLSNIGIKPPKEDPAKDDPKLRGTPTYKRAGITPELSASTLVDKKEKSVGEYRKLGFIAAHTVPLGGMIPGQGAIILLGGDRNPVLRENVSMYNQLAGAGGVYPATVIGVMAKYRDMYKKAEQMQQYQLKYASQSNGMIRPEKDATLEAMYPIVNRTLPAFFKGERMLDIMRIIALQKELGFKLMLGEVKQGWDIAEDLKNAKAPVFISLDLPKPQDKDGKEEAANEENTSPFDEEQKNLNQRKEETISKYYTQLGILSNNGISYGFSTLESKPGDFEKTMQTFLANGATSDQLLAALTTTPASILGLSNTMGTVETGKMANLIVTDKPYFEENAKVKMVFVDGVKYEYEDSKKPTDKKPAEVEGIWNYTVSNTPQGNGRGVITLEGSDGNYTGTITSNIGNSTSDLYDISVDGNSLSFSYKMNFGQEITLTVTVEIDGDTFEGNLSAGEFGSFPIDGNKEPN